MFAIAVELLCGRYTATHFNDRSQPEWPPHPARLFSAMVAAWADNDEPDSAERSALRWLEEQPPPEICCGVGWPRALVTHFVPVNDATALTRDVSRSYALVVDAHRLLREAHDSCDERAANRARAALARAETNAMAAAARVAMPTGRETPSMVARALEVLPESRGKQGRTYPTVLPDDQTVWFVWPDADVSEQQRIALDRVLGRVGRIGHSSTLVACRCHIGKKPVPSLIPDRGYSATRLRVPRAGLVDRLEAAFAGHAGVEPRTLPAGMVSYIRPAKPKASRRSPLLGGDWYVLGITGRRLPSAIQALTIARTARASLIAHGDQPSPEILSGHEHGDGRDGPTRPLNRPHLAVVPLPNAGSPYSDGALFGIALILPAGCPDGDREVVERAIRSWAAAGFDLVLPVHSRDQPVRLKLEYLGVERADGASEWLDAAIGARRRTTRRDYWCRSAQSWLTVSPIALDRFPGNLRSREPRARERAEVEATAAIARACVFAGLADRAEQVRVTVRLDAPLTGLPASPAGRPHDGHRYFPGYQTGTGTPRACVHAEIQFAEPVLGPVLVGAGRYLGYGLCLPRNAVKENP